MAEILNGDGTVSGGTVSSEDAPGDGAAPSGPPRSELQVKALAAKDEIMGRGLRGEPLTPHERQRLHELSKFADGLTPNVPLELRMAQEPDHRPADSGRSELEEVTARAIPQQERDRLISSAVLHGAPREAGEAAMAVAEKLGMDVADTGTFMRRIGHFAEMGHVGADAVERLAPGEQQEIAELAARQLGGWDKFEAITTEVREFLGAKGVLDALEKGGYTDSVLALDPRTLITLKHAADVWKAKGRK